nr:FCD domain-containing protein [Metabacillus sediminilitoris]
MHGSRLLSKFFILFHSYFVHYYYNIGNDADYLFYREIVKASGSRYLMEFMKNLDELNRGGLAFSLRKNIGLPWRREQVYKEHLQVFNFIQQKSPTFISGGMNAIKAIQF